MFQNGTRERKSHEKMSGKIILSRIRVNANEIAWKCRNERKRHFVQFSGQCVTADVENLKV